MMKKGLVLLCSLIFAAVTGCATAINDTAPANAGSIYAVGHKEKIPTIWKCPAQPTQEKCKLITVVEHNE